MSVIQRIRDKGAWIVFAIIALALIAFILQDSSLSRGNMFTNTTTIGKVNGEKIERTDFETNMELINQANGGQITREQLIPSVWNMMVEQKVMQQEYNKLGLAFTGRELSDLLFGNNPPQWFVQAFTDPNTGQMDMNRARQAITQLKKSTGPEAEQFQAAYLQPTIDQALRQKYQALVTGAIYVPKWMAEKTNADNSAIASVSYVSVPYATIADNTIKITDDEINAYVKKHSAEFESKEETRSVSYLTFDAYASQQDTAAVYNQLVKLKSEFSATTDPKSFVVSKGSEIPFYENYVTKSNLKIPAADTVRSLGVGQVYGPYVDGNNLTLAKMISKRTLPDSVKVRHLLVKTADRGQPVLADSIAKRRIDSAVTAIQGGADFATLVQTISDDPGSKTTKGEYDFSSNQFGTISKEFAETAFYGSVGTKKVVKVENAQYAGYHYIEVLDQKKIEEGYQIAYISKPIIPSNETVSAASTAAAQFAATSKSKKDFDANAAKLKKTPLEAADVRENDYTVGTLGSNRNFVRWIYESEAGDVSEPTELGDRYVVAIITAVNKPGTMSAAAARSQVEPILRNEKKAQQIIAKIKGTTLEAVASSVASTVQRADSLSFQAPFIANVGNEPKIVGAAFNKNIAGKISEAIAGNTGVFVVRGESVAAKASLTDINSVRQMTEQNLKSQAGYRAMGALRLAADVKDNRFKFY
jgi:peptidyl-prolyl cis-trans isomerase D